MQPNMCATKMGRDQQFVTHVTIDHVMATEKRCGSLDSCFGLVGPHQQSIPQVLSLASQVYKERSTCGFELMRFIPTRRCQYRAKTRIHVATVQHNECNDGGGANCLLVQ